MALVPFNLNNQFTNMKTLPERHFDFANEHYVVKQNWKDDGKGGTEVGFGACVYGASIVLSDYIALHPEVVENKTVCELGSGVGLVSIVAGRSGAPCVVACDGDSESMRLTSENIIMNNLEGIVTTKQFLWGDDEAHKDLGRFDVILGSDIVACPYADAFQDLLKTLNSLSHSSNSDATTKVILSYQPRNNSEELFFQQLEQQGWEREVLSSFAVHPDFLESGIQLMTLTRYSKR